MQASIPAPVSLIIAEKGIGGSAIIAKDIIEADLAKATDANIFRKRIVFQKIVANTPKKEITSASELYTVSISLPKTVAGQNPTVAYTSATSKGQNFKKC